mgnify:CR=1 FL=1
MLNNKSITYNSNLLKGTGLIQEMLTLIEAYKPGESALEFQKRVLNDGILSKSTDTRTIDVVRNIFRTRFLDQKLNIPSHIKLMREKYVSMEVINQIFLIYTCRANPILADFISEVYFNLIKKGVARVTTEDPKIFIKSAIVDGRIQKSWSKSTIERVSEHINACLIDFQLVNNSKEILPFRAFDLTVNYLIHELHFQGYNDMNILDHYNWKIFDLDRSTLIPIIERISFKGTYIYQYSGEIMKIEWKYKSMEEFIKNECR